MGSRSHSWLHNCIGTAMEPEACRGEWSFERSGAAPSWSWASIAGPLCYRHRERRYISSKVLFTPDTSTMTQTPRQIGSADFSLSLKDQIYAMTLQVKNLESTNIQLQ